MKAMQLNMNMTDLEKKVYSNLIIQGIVGKKCKQVPWTMTLK